MTSPLNLTGSRRVTTMLQAETSECGIACLAMIASYHGRHEDLISLRHRFGSASRGLNLNQLINCANDLEMTPRALRCEIEEVAGLNLPAIIHWDFNHFVVLESATKTSIRIHDPAIGERTISLAEAGHHFTGIALELSPADTFRASAPRKRPGLASWFSGLRSLLPALAQILVLSAILQVVALATPFYMQIVVDEVLVKHDVDLLSLLALGFLGLTLFALIARALRGWAGIYLTHQLSYYMGVRLFRHLLRLPVGFFQSRHMGDLVSRFASLKPIQDFLTSSTIAVLLDGVMAITTIAMMFIYSPSLASVALVTMVLFLLLQLAFYSPIKKRNHEYIAAEAGTESKFMESLRTIGPIKRFGVEAARTNEWQNRFADSINARVRTSRLELAVELIESAMSGMTNVLLVFLGARQVLAGELSIGMFYAFLAYRSHMTTAVMSLVNHLVQYLMLSLHLERLADIQLAEPEETGRAVSRRLTGSLAINSGAFQYAANEPPIFQDIDINLAPGESMAIFGPSGCGKSTLLKAVQGLMPLTGGEILLDGKPLDVIGTANLRAQSASVMQGDDLLSGSLLENIAFGDIQPDIQRIHWAAALSEIHEDILALPMAYESMVGEMGASLSAGQIQRILIARAVYRQPRLLFLDEGTAHLDAKTEQKVMRNILSLDTTCIFVTHNRKQLALADQVLVMDQTRHAVRRIRQKAA